MYEYYPKTDDVNHIEQLVEVKGSWSIKDSTVKIDWQPNKMFPRETMIFTVKKDEYSPYLKGEKRELHTEESVEALDYKSYPEYKTAYKEILNKTKSSKI